MCKANDCLTKGYDCQKLKHLNQMGKADDAFVEFSPDEKRQERTCQHRNDINTNYILGQTGN